MNKGSIFGSLDRIEAALDRLEAVPLPPAARQSASDPLLEARHQQLKVAVLSALDRLDALLEEPQG